MPLYYAGFSAEKILRMKGAEAAAGYDEREEDKKCLCHKTSQLKETVSITAFSESHLVVFHLENQTIFLYYLIFLKQTF